MLKNPIDPILIDRLVDGELGEAERRELLLRLESNPDGWRRCALAFIEAQEFGRAAVAWTREHAPACDPTPRPAIAPTRGPRPIRRALAASLLPPASYSGLPPPRPPVLPTPA